MIVHFLRMNNPDVPQKLSGTALNRLLKKNRGFIEAGKF
jgi:hypothetical protein